MTSTGSAARLLDPGFRFVFFKFLAEHDMEYTSVFNILTSERAYEEDIVFAGLGAVPEKSEGSDVFWDHLRFGRLGTYRKDHGLPIRPTLLPNWPR